MTTMSSLYPDNPYIQDICKRRGVFTLENALRLYGDAQAKRKAHMASFLDYDATITSDRSRADGGSAFPEMRIETIDGLVHISRPKLDEDGDPLVPWVWSEAFVLNRQDVLLVISALKAVAEVLPED